MAHTKKSFMGRSTHSGSLFLGRFFWWGSMREMGVFLMRLTSRWAESASFRIFHQSHVHTLAHFVLKPIALLLLFFCFLSTTIGICIWSYVFGHFVNLNWSVLCEYVMRVVGVIGSEGIVSSTVLLTEPSPLPSSHCHMYWYLLAPPTHRHTNV